MLSDLNIPKITFRTKEVAESHAKLHEAQERVSDQLYQEGTPYCQEESCPREKHYHCTWVRILIFFVLIM